MEGGRDGGKERWGWRGGEVRKERGMEGRRSRVREGDGGLQGVVYHTVLFCYCRGQMC